jgi:hypothetical protein
MQTARSFGRTLDDLGKDNRTLTNGVADSREVYEMVTTVYQ